MISHKGAQGREDRTAYSRQQYAINKDNIGFDESKDDIRFDENKGSIKLDNNQDVLKQSTVSNSNNYGNEDMDNYGDYGQVKPF